MNDEMEKKLKALKESIAKSNLDPSEIKTLIGQGTDFEECYCRACGITIMDPLWIFENGNICPDCLEANKDPWLDF